MKAVNRLICAQLNIPWCPGGPGGPWSPSPFLPFNPLGPMSPGDMIGLCLKTNIRFRLRASGTKMPCFL